MGPFGTGWKLVRLRVLLCGLALAFIAGKAEATPQATPDPNCFFTTVASRLLSEEMGMKLSCIQIYPTNQYTPAVHRLLQVTANIYDCTTTNYYPSVFRPLFWKTNEFIGGGVYQTNIYITGYQYVQEPLSTNGPPIFTMPTDASDPTILFGSSGMSNNIYGIPWVIGVKKGLPNFNALEMESCFFIERELQFTRSTINSSGRIYTTNQMYIMGVSNILGVEFWNSYAAAFTNPVTIVAQDTLSFALTNDAGVTVANGFVTNSAYTQAVWPGASFFLPLGSNCVVMQPLNPLSPSPNGTYVYFSGPGSANVSGFPFTGPCFIPTSLDPSNFVNVGTPPLPNFGMAMTNHLQAYIEDTNGYILDYVQLGDMDSSLNVNQAIADNSEGFSQGLWSTNFYPETTMPFGVFEQLLVSEGMSIPPEDADGGFWSTMPIPGTGGNTSPAAQQAFFEAFFSANNIAAYEGATSGIITNDDLTIVAPFTPTRLPVQRMFFEADDPLVHYLASDLADYPDDTNFFVGHGTVPSLPLGTVNDRYAPWGIVGNMAGAVFGTFVDKNAYNLAYKDPLVSKSDDWNFPTNETLNASWLGQVHRGTPWQTIFLKSTNILNLVPSTSPGQPPNFVEGLGTWQLWTGDLDATDAIAMAPPADWHMASFLASLFETDYPYLFSVNDPNPGDWENLMNGMTVLTNDLSNIVLGSGFVQQAQFASLIISSNSSQAATIANAIESARMAQPGQYFTNVGDIFAIPQLSDTSPYLNTNIVQVQKGISDEAYEAIPSQLLPLLRVDSIGSIVPASGQVVIQFTGDDNHAYAVQVSSNLLNWTNISTNCPVQGTFSVTNAVTVCPRFYRTVFVQ